jgi:hypothetical protein
MERRIARWTECLLPERGMSMDLSRFLYGVLIGSAIVGFVLVAL